MHEQRSVSAGQGIAALRQFFRARRTQGESAGGASASDDWQPTLWPQTEWSDTQTASLAQEAS